jgi:hypothetical protein
MIPKWKPVFGKDHARTKDKSERSLTAHGGTAIRRLVEPRARD